MKSFAPATPAAAAPGDLDSTFGSGGKVTTPIGSGSAVANGVAVQADGKLVAAGSSTGGFTLVQCLAAQCAAGDGKPTFAVIVRN